MISKAKSCPGGTALFNYVVNEKKGYELLRNNLSGITPKNMFSDMTIIQQQNSRCKNNTISMVLSPTIEDSKIMSNKELKTLTMDYLKAMDLEPDTNQFIAYVHTEKEHKHIHILLNRVLLNGSLINDSFISKRSQSAAHKIALKYGYISAKNIKEAKEYLQEFNNKEVKVQIKKAHFKVLKTNPKDLMEYINRMKKWDIKVLPTINKQGKIQGYRFIYEPTGVNLKASEVDRNLKLNKLFSRDISKKTESSNENISQKEWKVNSLLINELLLSTPIINDVDSYQESLRKKRKKRKPKL